MSGPRGGGARAGRGRAVPAALLGAAIAVLLGAALRTDAQITENPKDPFGIAIPYPRVRLLHSGDPRQEGTSAHLRAYDPFLFYQTGRDLLHRQFSLAHGVLGQSGALAVPLYVGSTARLVHGAPARFARDHSASCGMCHGSIYREPGAGQTIGSTGGMGRNSTHFYGAGLVEMIGQRVTAELLAAYDRDGDGLIGRAEAAAPSPARVAPVPGAEPVDYGDLAPGPDGVPRLDTAFRIWYADARGRPVPEAVSLDHPGVAAYGFVLQPFGWGRGRALIDGRQISQGGEAATVREFYAVAADFHMGMQAHDPTQLGADPLTAGAGGYAQVSLNGARQYDFGGSVDRGLSRAVTGLSLDDPDGDGHYAELTEGDLDAIEFYLLHAPPPAVLATERSERGRAVLIETGCTRCHVESWRLPAAGELPGFAGDRRLFHLAARSAAGAGGLVELTGELVRLDRALPTGERAPAGGEFTVERVYSDFKHWDVGPEYHERRFDGTLQREHRTAPLWGAANSAPYGHSGRLMTLHEAIAAHGGAAQAARDAYLALPAAERAAVIDYLRSLVLYPTDEIPADVDGNGEIAEDFAAGGTGMGYERFDARLLFVRPPAFESLGRLVQPNGRSVPAALVGDAEHAYGLDLVYRLDGDGDGYPDALDPTPQKTGACDEPEPR